MSARVANTPPLLRSQSSPSASTREISAQLFDEAARMPWTIVSSNFDAYISAARRPYFSPQVKAARACIAIVDFDVDPVQAVEATRYLHQIFGSRISVIALAESRDPELLLIAMRAGCSEFLQQAARSRRLSRNPGAP